jgi:hypothetical protein
LEKSDVEHPSTIPIDSFIWITSLEQQEQGATDRILEDLGPLLDQANKSWSVHEPKSANELLELLHSTARLAAVGCRPLLHFDTHGDKMRGIRISASGEFISWSILNAALRAININTKNNLCIVSGACFSIGAVLGISMAEACPYFIMIAPNKEVESGFLEDNLIKFYRFLFSEFDIGIAYERHLSSRFSIFRCERMLAILLANYVREQCSGRAGDRLAEERVTLAVNAGRVRNREAMRKARKLAKSFSRPNRQMIERFANNYAFNFLIGKPLSFDIGDVLRLAKSKLAPSKPI